MRAAALEGLTVAAFARDDFEAAAQHASRLTELAPSVYNDWFNLGVAFQRLGRLQEAIQAYQRARDIREEAVYAHLNLGVALPGTRRPEPGARVL